MGAVSSHFSKRNNLTKRDNECNDNRRSGAESSVYSQIVRKSAKKDEITLPGPQDLVYKRRG